MPWYPARVAWVHHGRYIGWVPITPYEVYYGRRYWGPRSVVYHENIRHVEFHKYVNVNRVVIIDKDRLYGVHRRYETTRDVHIVKEVVNNGRAAPVVTRDVVKGADLKMEHHFARSGDFSRKPNVDAVSEFASRRRGGAGGTQTAQGPGEGIQKASLKTSDAKSGQPSVAKPGDENKRNLPATPRELKREERQERRLEAKGEHNFKQASGQQPAQQQQKQRQQQQVAERQQQQQPAHQDAQQRRQQQSEQRQQQQLAHQQQQALRQQQLAERQQQQAQRQQQLQAQKEQQTAQRQQQAQAQQQQQAQRQQQQAQPRQNQKQTHQKQQQ